MYNSLKMLRKKEYIILILVFLIVNCSAVKNFKTEPTVNIIKPKQPEITKMVTSIYSELKNRVAPDRTVFVIRIHNLKVGQKLDVTIYNKSDFGWQLRDTKEIPYGLFKYNNLPVVVFGQSCDKFFTATNENILLEWLQPLPPLADDKVYIPISFEPPIWSYEYVAGGFTFKGIEN